MRPRFPCRPAGGPLLAAAAVVGLGILWSAATSGGAGPAQVVPRPAIDRFECYESDPQTRFERREVTLRDQFHEERATLLPPNLLCNPVKLDGQAQQQRRVHLSCHPLERISAFEARSVFIRDGFWTQPVLVRVMRPERLCVPSFKEEFLGGISARRIDDISRRRLRRILPRRLLRLNMRRLKRAITPARPRGRPDSRHDHYKCYAVEPQPTPRTVRLRDQFEAGRAPVVDLVSLCNPVDYERQGIANEQQHLTCYRIRDRRPRFRRLDVRVWNQFRLADLTVVRPVRLCLPAIKYPQLVIEPTPSPTPSPPIVTPEPPLRPAPDPRCDNPEGPTILGTEGPDVIVGTSGPDHIDGLGGDDRIEGLEGKDVLCGGAGNDRIIGGPESTPLPDGDRLFGGAGSDVISGGAGREAAQGGPPPASDDAIAGDEGNDRIDAGAGGDTAGGGDGADVIDGRGGFDILAGGAGDDTVDAGPGSGTVGGGSGNDQLYGGPGDDQVSGAEIDVAVTRAITLIKPNSGHDPSERRRQVAKALDVSGA